MALDKLWFYLLGVGALAGTIVGVGMFGLPFTASKAGLPIALLYLLIFGGITALTHLLYFEVALHTKSQHRFTGYVGIYLGNRWKFITLIQSLISLWGVLLVYTIIGGKFLDLIAGSALNPFLKLSSSHTEIFFGIAFFIVSSLVVLKGSYTVGNQELLFSFPLIIMVFVIFFEAISSSSFSLATLSPVYLPNISLPYGITLFSLAGFSVIPTLRVILSPGIKKGYRFNFPLIIFLGTLIPALLYAFFIIGVLGVSKDATSPDALKGLEPFLGKGITLLGAVLGILAIYTSFIAIGEELYHSFIDDYQKSPLLASLAAFMPPLLFYIFQVSDFITLINIIGAIMGGYVGVIVIILFWRAMKRGGIALPFSFILSKYIGGAIIAVFIFASLLTLFNIMRPFLI